MGKRKGRKEAKEPQIPAAADEIGKNGEEEEEEEEKGSGFFVCYLLTSLCPRFKGHTYIGYTVNPRRRIRQHNGELGRGAWRTKRKRPWEMVLCIYGFPTNVAALQFEWAWQHPVESLAVRKAAACFKSLSGLANKIKLAYTMLSLPPWQSLNLTVNLFSTKYQHYTSACPALPEQMWTQVCSMDELPCYNVNLCINEEWDDIESECNFQQSKDKESTEAVREEVHNSPNCYHISEENFNQQINHTDAVNIESSGYLARTWEGFESMLSPIREEKDPGRFCMNNNSLVGTSFSCSSSYVAEDTQGTGLVELTTGCDEPLNKQPATAMDADQYRVLTNISSREVEIVDIFTPSPCYPEKTGSKKRRRPNLCPELIDLTNSPIFV